jgi:hypothetical protein
MNRTSILENDFISIWVVPERKLVHSVMNTYVFGDAYRNALTTISEAMESHQLTKWLADLQAQSAVPPDDLEWTSTHWRPRMMAAGWRHWAIVQPTKIIGQVRMERVSKLWAEQGLNARTFVDPDEALRWIDGL